MGYDGAMLVRHKRPRTDKPGNGFYAKGVYPFPVFLFFVPFLLGGGMIDRMFEIIWQILKIGYN